MAKPGSNAAKVTKVHEAGARNDRDANSINVVRKLYQTQLVS